MLGFGSLPILGRFEQDSLVNIEDNFIFKMSDLVSPSLNTFSSMSRLATPKSTFLSCLT